MAYSNNEKNKILNDIFSLIENGMSTRKAIKEMGISSSTFFEWIDRYEDKAKQYARACEYRAEALLDEMLDIVDDKSNDIVGEGKENERVNNEAIQRSRLRYDARRWLISKLNPKKYGDKIDYTTDGEKIPTNNTSSIILNVIPPKEEE